MGLQQTEKCLQRKGKDQKSEKATSGIGENMRNHIPDKGLISEYIKNSFNLVTRKQITPLKNRQGIVWKFLKQLKNRIM